MAVLETKKEYFRAFYQGNRLLYAAVMVLDICYNFLLILLSVTLGDLMDLAADGTMPAFLKSCIMIAVFLILSFTLDALSERLRSRFLITLCVLIHYNLSLTLFAMVLCILPLAIMLLMGKELTRRERNLHRGRLS